MGQTNCDRQKIIDRILSLEAMTEENGCTPAEAQSAQEAAERLRSRYGIAKKTIEEEKKKVREEEPSAFVQERAYPSPDNSRHLNQVVNIAAMSVAGYFRCRGFSVGSAYVFVGEERDVGAAHDLLSLLCQAAKVHHESLKSYVKQFINDTPVAGEYLHPRAIATEFRKGFGLRVAIRYCERDGAQSPLKSTSREVELRADNDVGDFVDDLMVIFEEKFKQRPLSYNFRGSDKDTWAFVCGWIAGSRVKLFPWEVVDNTDIDWDSFFTSHSSDEEPEISADEFRRPYSGHRAEPVNLPSTPRSFANDLISDLVYSIGWALFRMGWLFNAIGFVGLLFEPKSLHQFAFVAVGPVPEWLPAALVIVGITWVTIGEALGGDERRPNWK